MDNEKTEIESQVAEIAKLAAVVANQGAELEGATGEEASAEAALLRLVCERVQPALKALSSRVQIAGAYGGNAETEESFAEWRGLYLNLDDAKAGPARRGGFQANRGAFGGFDLFLCPDSSDGTGFQFRELAYSGRWSQWQGERDEWRAEVSHPNVEKVVAEYDVPKIIAAIEKALRAYATGNATKRAAEARATTDKLNAICSLLASK